MLHCILTILYYTLLYSTLLYSTLLYSTLLYSTLLYYTILYYTILYYTILYYTILMNLLIHLFLHDWLLYRFSFFMLVKGPNGQFEHFCSIRAFFTYSSVFGLKLLKPRLVYPGSGMLYPIVCSRVQYVSACKLPCRPAENIQVL